MITVEGLTKYYGRTPAVQDLKFRAERGEIVGFLGPNGAGKTTTMRILTGYMPPSSGTARIAGFDVVDESLEVRRRIGYLPESAALYPELTVYEYLEFMGSLRSVDDLPGRIETVLEQVHLEDRWDHYIGSLSKGMKQRVGLAQALVHEPEVLILDEPTIGLDPAQIIEVRELVQELGEERTVLLSTHILSEAQQVCDRVLIISRGKIVAEDTPDNLQAQLAGAERLIVKARADRDELRSMLLDLAEVSDVQDGETEDALEVIASGEGDARPAVARSVVGSGHDLLELRPIGFSLEEIFLQLTREAAEDEEETAE
ncbi:MAG: ABC transporter ATP-binding protein [Anaerolineales bacterium]|nr:ABC transporter ATP-binding protein [Anaerolineales bacterium]